MKSLKIWSLAVMLVLAAVGCDKESENIRVTLDDIVGEWHLVAMNNEEVPFSVSIVEAIHSRETSLRVAILMVMIGRTRTRCRYNPLRSV